MEIMEANSQLWTARTALDHLLSQPLRKLDDMPASVGLYGLCDHNGKPHYFGMTDKKSFKNRIWNRHISGSEDRSHKLACNYSVGRLWHDRQHPGANDRDGKVSRRVRQAFIRKHCRFVCLPLELTTGDLRRLEKNVIDLAGPRIADWNGTRVRMATFEEPRELVDDTIRELGISRSEIAALERQNAIYRSL
jgi:hypothetical protein